MNAQALYAEAKRLVAKLPDSDRFLDALIAAYNERRDRYLPGDPNSNIDLALVSAAIAIYENELKIPPPPPPQSGEIDHARYRDTIRARIRALADPRFLHITTTALADMVGTFGLFLPPLAFSEEEQAPDMVSLMSVMSRAREAALALIVPFQTKEVESLGLFADLRQQLDKNLEKLGYVYPQDAKVFEPSTYFSGTPLMRVFGVSIPLRIPERTRMEHTVIVAGSGWGKTQLLQSLIARDLEQDDPPSLIVLDSTGAMIQRVQRLAVFEKKLRDRILIIDPAHSPSLNMFDVSTPRFEAYSSEQKEDVQTEVIKLFSYVFDSADYDLTANMRAPFQAAVRLMLSRPGSTITDLRQLLEEPAPKIPGFAHSAFRADIEKLDKETQDFFAHHFFAAPLTASRTAIARRLHDLIGVPAIRRMFTATANTLDLFAEMQKGTVILVNTNQQLLKDDAMVLFGRFVIAKALSAALERAVLPENQRRPAYLIIDEAAPYFDETFEKLLTRVRQFKLGVVIAFQHLEQATDKLKSAIASSTSIKYAGGLGYSDRRWLAREMETAPEFIGAQRKDAADPPKWSQFATFVRNYTQNALSLTIPFYQLERMATMTNEAHAALLETNKKRVSAIAAPAPAPIVEPTLTPPPQTVESPAPPQLPPADPKPDEKLW